MSSHAAAKQRLLAPAALRGDAMSAALNPVRGVRDAAMRRGEKVKDHHRANLAKLRAQEREAVRRRRKAEEEEQARLAAMAEGRTPAAASPAFKMKRFATAEPKLSAEPLQRHRADRPKRTQFLRKGAAAAQEGPAPPRTHRRKQSLKPRVPTLAELNGGRPTNAGGGGAAGGQSRDFVRENAREAARFHVSREREEESALHSEFGEVPEYLQRRKVEMAAEQARREEERLMERVPEGMVRLSDAERERTLAVLRKNKAEFEHTLARFPLVCEVPSRVARKKELEDKIDEIEKAIEVFSREHVFVTA